MNMVAAVERLKLKLNSMKLGDERNLLSHVATLKELLKTSEAYNLFMTVELFLKSNTGVHSLKEVYKYVGTSTTLDEVLTAILNFIKYRIMFKTDLTMSIVKKDKTCYNCGLTGHLAKFSRKGRNFVKVGTSIEAKKINFSKNNDEQEVSFNCKSIPANFSGRHKKLNKTKEFFKDKTLNKTLDLDLSVLSEKLAYGIWYLDSGAACSITWDKEVFIDYNSINETDKKAFK